jgi:hypothetical protein
VSISFFANFIDDQSSINLLKPKSLQPMITNETTETVTVFLQNLPGAVSKLKNRLQRDYERAYPGLHDLIRIVLDEEEGNARKLSTFPHLLLPDLVEAHIAQLGLEPVNYENLFRPVRIAADQNHNHQLTPAYVDS